MFIEEILQGFSSKIVSFNADISNATGGIMPGLFCSHLLYWTRYSDNGWVFRTQKQIQDDTCMTVDNQRTAIKKLKKLDIIEVRKVGLPAKNHYYIDQKKLAEVLRDYFLKMEEKEKEEENKQLSDNQQSSGIPTTGNNTDNKSSGIPTTGHTESPQQVEGNPHNITNSITNNKTKKNNLIKGKDEIQKLIESHPIFKFEVASNWHDKLSVEIEKYINKIKSFNFDNEKHRRNFLNIQFDSLLSDLEKKKQYNLIVANIRKLNNAECLNSNGLIYHKAVN